MPFARICALLPRLPCGMQHLRHNGWTLRNLLALTDSGSVFSVLVVRFFVNEPTYKHKYMHKEHNTLHKCI